MDTEIKHINRLTVRCVW